jgi:hypothetical protein
MPCSSSALSKSVCTKSFYKKYAPRRSGGRTYHTLLLEQGSLFDKLIDSLHRVTNFSHFVDGNEVLVKSSAQLSEVLLKLPQLKTLVQFDEVALPKIVKRSFRLL